MHFGRSFLVPLLPYWMNNLHMGVKIKTKKNFGYRLSSARMVIEYGFGRLKARVGSLRREMNIKSENLPQCINSCFILYNFCEMRKEGLNGSDLDKSLRLEKEFSHRSKVISKLIIMNQGVKLPDKFM